MSDCSIEAMKPKEPQTYSHMTNELKPCPFCGKQPKFIPATCDDIGNDYECRTLAVIQCDTCLYEMAHETDEQAIMAWNTRYKRTCHKVPGKTYYGERRPKCSECGYSIGDNRWNFCPKCGAEICGAEIVDE